MASDVGTQRMSSSWVLVAGDFVDTGGMDAANLALATHLAAHGHDVHLATHRATQELARREGVTVHPARKPLDSYLFGVPFLDHTGRRVATQVQAGNANVLVNGGNCLWGDVNWVHYVHHAFRSSFQATSVRGLVRHGAHVLYLRRERAALQRARLVIANSRRTKEDIVTHLEVPAERVKVVYYGTAAERYLQVDRAERDAIRAELGWSTSRPIVIFVGALGDRRKGFDTLFGAFKRLCARPDWDVDLKVVGVGSELPDWERRTREAGLDRRIQYLGFRRDVVRLLQSSDVLVAPTRYEAYGLAVHEAICCGVPALVSATAGVAERYPSTLETLLLHDPDDVDQLCERLVHWRGCADAYAAAARDASRELRRHSWDDMARQIAALVQR
jgi:glycosyltransferase involved in cell wall biosynthesis